MDSQNKRLERLLSSALGGASVETESELARGITPANVTGSFGTLRLRILWAGAGWPADVRRAIEGVGEVDARWPRDLLVAATELSPGALELLADRDANWVDEVGQARIVDQGVLVIREGSKEPRARRHFSWSPSAIAIAEGLLAKDWSEGVRTTELATLIQWSPPQVSQVLQSFDDEGWTAKYGAQRGPSARREIVDPEAMLDRWAEAVTQGEREERQAHRTLRSPLAFLEEELAEALDGEVRWAISGWAAAHELAPMADLVPGLQIYVHEDDFERPLDEAISRAGLKNVAEGGRISFFSASPSVLTLTQSTRTGPLVSSPRIYADLLALGGRAEDAAHHLKEEILDVLHPPAQQRRDPPGGLLLWEEATRDRLDALADRRGLDDVYSHGSWSASYRLLGTDEAPAPQKFLGILREVAGRESGWPPWWIPESGESRPRPVDGAIECWFAEIARRDPENADFWRADPDGRLCLIRTYQEDWALERSTPGETLDLVLPILRAAECLRHANRMADRLGASSIQFMQRWTGLAGRCLGSPISRRRRVPPPSRESTQDEVVTFVEVKPREIAEDLPGVVARLVSPLYASFDFFEPPPDTYEEELDRYFEGEL